MNKGTEQIAQWLSVCHANIGPRVQISRAHVTLGGWVWHPPIIPALKRWRQEDFP